LREGVYAQRFYEPSRLLTDALLGSESGWKIVSPARTHPFPKL
jgi:hypothetical protein